ncbi:thioesterase [Sterolibacterium denitrificans]|nr:acyl-CoA thioesterase [Sterolibacterium denitrificans]KYC29602.1 thioesterase [Sterolibacterium denitrificans]
MTTLPATQAVEIRELVLPMLANHHGTLFAGQGLQLMAKVAFMAARSLSRLEVVMAAASGINFLSPIPIGHVLTLRGQVVRVGRSSMTVQVSGVAEKAGSAAEDVLGGTFEMVAIDADGRPAAINLS